MTKTGLLTEMIECKKMETKRRRKVSLTRSRREAVLREHVLPHLPASMSTQFKLASYSVDYSIILILQATRDLNKSEKNVKLALGLITKSVRTLKTAGWTIDEEPAASVNEASTVSKLKVSFQAGKTIKNRYQVVHLVFQGFNDTPACRLVEKDVIIAATHTPERTEKRMVIECDEKEEGK